MPCPAIPACDGCVEECLTNTAGHSLLKLTAGLSNDFRTCTKLLRRCWGPPSAARPWAPRQALTWNHLDLQGTRQLLFDGWSGYRAVAAYDGQDDATGCGFGSGRSGGAAAAVQRSISRRSMVSAGAAVCAPCRGPRVQPDGAGESPTHPDDRRIRLAFSYLHLSCVSTAFVAKTVPFRAVLRVVCHGSASPR